MIYIFYHILCTKNTEELVRDQCVKIIFSGLYEKTENISCFLLGDETYRETIKNLFAKMGSKFIIAGESTDTGLWERFTLTNIKQFISTNDKILYIHSKGITRIETDANYSVREWRECMEYWLIAKADECINKLDEYDMVGLLYYDDPHPHFSGNFWWSTAKYFLTLPDTIGGGYQDPEMFVQCNKPKIFIIHNPGRGYPGYTTEGQWTFSTYIM